MESNGVSEYHTLFQSVKSPWLYAYPWWLDATCGQDGWEAVVRLGPDGLPIAALPYQRTRIRGLSALITPPLTQWITVLGGEGPFENLSMSLLGDLPVTSILDLSMRPDVSLRIPESTLPITLKYSFTIPPSTSQEDHRRGYNEGLRRNIRQAEKQYTIEISGDTKVFLALCRNSYGQQKMKPPAWLETVVTNVHLGLISRQCGLICLAMSNGKPIAGIMVGWDPSTTYYLAGGRTADDQGASAHALLLDHALRAAHDRNTVFDFEGSMHPGIANFFQSFGAEPAPYWQIKKYRGLGKIWSLLSK